MYEPTLSSDSAEVRGGSPDGNHPQVGRLVMPTGGGSFMACTGTLVDAETVVTAGHCFVEFGDDFRFRDPRFVLGFDANSGAALEYDIESIVPHIGYLIGDDTYDVAFVKLAMPVTGVAPIPLSQAVPATGSGTFVGYGRRGNGESGERYYASASFAISNDQEVESPSDQLCSGDSGGPLVMDGPGGLEVVATLSRGGGEGSDGCGGPNTLIRADFAAEYLDAMRSVLDVVGGDGRIAIAGSFEISAGGGAGGTVTAPLSGPSWVAVAAFSSGPLRAHIDSSSDRCSDSGEFVFCIINTSPGETVDMNFASDQDSRSFYQVFVHETASSPESFGDGSSEELVGCSCASGGGRGAGSTALLIIGAFVVAFRRRRDRTSPGATWPRRSSARAGAE